MSVLDELRRPIVQAPMGGGPGNAALATAVGEAGGLGFLAAGYKTPEAVRDEIAAVRAHTRAPFGVNVFVPWPDAGVSERVAAYADALRAEAAELGVEPGELRYEDDRWSEKLELVAAERVPVVSFTFGCPPADVVAELRAAGCEVWATATEVSEAVAAVEAGADGLALQGVEAGGHRGSWRDEDGHGELGLLALVRLVAREVGVPLVAAGGLVDGAGIAAVLVAGARAAALGTAFMLCPEASTATAHRAALAAGGPSALTRAFTGRRARGLVNRFLAEHEGAPSAYPQIHHLTAPLRAAARERGDADALNLWAGQGAAAGALRAMPAGELVRVLAEEAEEALAEVCGRLMPGKPAGERDERRTAAG